MLAARIFQMKLLTVSGCRAFRGFMFAAEGKMLGVLVFRIKSVTDCISLKADTLPTSLHCDRQGARLLVSLKQLSKFVQKRVRLQGNHDNLNWGALELVCLSSILPVNVASDA